MSSRIARKITTAEQKWYGVVQIAPCAVHDGPVDLVVECTPLPIGRYGEGVGQICVVWNEADALLVLLESIEGLFNAPVRGMHLDEKVIPVDAVFPFVPFLFCLPRKLHMVEVELDIVEPHDGIYFFRRTSDHARELQFHLGAIVFQIAKQPYVVFITDPQVAKWRESRQAQSVVKQPTPAQICND